MAQIRGGDVSFSLGTGHTSRPKSGAAHTARAEPQAATSAAVSLPLLGVTSEAACWLKTSAAFEPKVLNVSVLLSFRVVKSGAHTVTPTGEKTDRATERLTKSGSGCGGNKPDSLQATCF